MSKGLKRVVLALAVLLGAGMLAGAYVVTAVMPAGALLEQLTPDFIKYRWQLKFGWFYRVNVQLIYENEPLDIEIIVACASQARQIFGEGRSVRAVYAPYMFGVRVRGGHGVLVQSPSICQRNFERFPVPDDYLPIIFWAPDANNLEFLIAYLHERAYEQPVSRLKFVRATITEVTEADHKAWRATRWKDNIIPLADRYDDQLLGVQYFRGDRFFPRDDLRSFGISSILYCHYYLRLPLPEVMRAELRALRPPGEPRFWLIPHQTAATLRARYHVELRDEVNRRNFGTWGDTNGGPGPLEPGLGLLRPSGTGHLGVRGRDVAAGQAPRIPYRVETGYPWVDQRLHLQRTLDLNIDTAGGADQGFAYCFRDAGSAFFLRDSNNRLPPRDQRYFIDGNLVAEAPGLSSLLPGMTIVENDEYLWANGRFGLKTELGSMQ
ncbi:hypothetical protein [Phreatobacter sp. AB_2022a]|uniref:hypothetical protein n=1 Tax=Phreatobacter sp. AB_2022a TaxID=3003134 RepID=UPI002287592E|nr:hypothetical protein [Phreatobacter sp. AB_2022a]MCZ0733022.1 hypothetical protein [Phreatobacter sp. AB_2022a]